jgi:dolichol-phosphate mannosyltransferase
MDKEITVIIPAYKASKSIQTVINGIPDFVKHVIVVDDASPDNTVDVIKNIADDRIVLVTLEKNLGVGGAMLAGYEKAIQSGAEILVKMDSDDQMDSEYLIPLLMPILRGEADYTKGNRFLHLTQLSQMPKIRIFGNLWLSIFTKFSSGYWNVFDPTNGYTAIHKDAYARLETKRIDLRYFFEISMLNELGIQQAVVRDIYIPAKYQDEVSHLSITQTLVTFPSKIIKGLLRRIWIRYFIRDFSTFSINLICGSGLFLFGLIFGMYHWIQSNHSQVAATTGTVMLAVLPLILGFQLLLQAFIEDTHNIPHAPIQKEQEVFHEAH